MSDTPIDKLVIEINTESEKANDKIDALCSEIEKLAASIGRLNGNKLTGLQDLQKATEGVSKIATDLVEKYKDLGKGFTLKGNTTQIQKEIDKLSNAFARANLKKEMLEASGNIGGKMFEYAVRDTQMYGNQIESLKNQINSIEEIKLSPELELKFENLEQSENQVKKIVEEIPKVVEIPAESFGYNQEALEFIESYSERARETVQELTEKLSGLTVPEVRIYNLDKLGLAIEKEEEKLEELRNKLSNELVMGTITESADDKGYVRLREQIALAEKQLEAFHEKKVEVENSPSVKLDDFRNKIQKVGTTLSKVTSKFSKFANGIKSIFSKITSLSKSMLGITKSSTGMNVSLAGGLVTVLKYAFGVRTLFSAINKLKSAIKDGMNNLVQFSSETNTSISLLTNSLTQFKNATASAVSPLLNALAPALNTIIQWCVSAANAVNQLISSLTGKSTWVKAKKLTDDYASGLDNANSSAKKLYSTTLGIDELNINSGETDSGSGSSGTSAKDMFEEAPIDDRWANIANWLKSMWEDADFTELGTLLGKKLKAALDSIEWEPIKETAAKIGKSIATLINGFVEVEGLGYSIGKTLGEAINTGITGINAFLDNTHWDSVGKFLGEGANGVVDYINFKDIGHMFAQKWNAIFETIGEFARTFDWVNFGLELSNGLTQAVSDFDWEENAESLSNFVKGCLDTIITFFEETDWQDIGNKVADFIGAIDWNGLFDKLSEGIRAVLGGLSGFLWGLIEDAWNDVVDWWKDTAYEDGEFTMQGLFDGILEKLNNIGTWIKEHIFQPFIDGFKNAFGIHSPSTVMAEMGSYIVEGLWNGIKDAWSWLTGSIKNFCDEFVGKFKDFLGIHSPSKVFEENGKYVVEGFNNGIINNDSNSAIFSWINSIKQSFSPKVWQPIFNQIGESFRMVWEELIDWFNNTALVSFFDESIIPNFGYDKWSEVLKNGMFLSIQNEWHEFRTNWDSWMILWQIGGVIPYFGYNKWYDILKNGMVLAISTQTKRFISEWKQNINNWWNTSVLTMFKYEKWYNMLGYTRNAFKVSFEEIYNTINKKMESSYHSVSDWCSKMISQLEKVMTKISDVSSTTGNARVSYSINNVSVANLTPTPFATGGIVKRPTFSLIGEDGPEAVVPLSENSEWIRNVANQIENHSYNGSDELLREQNELLRQQNELLSHLADKEIIARIDPDRETITGLRNAERRLGYSFTG